MFPFRMPYTEAVIYETLRFSTLLPGGVFHRALETKEFQGYTILKGSWIIANLYSVHYNKETWGDPEVFRPSRFLSVDGLFVVKHDALLAFLTGKRACLGEPLAKDTLFLFIASIFQRFQIYPDPANPKVDLEPMVGFLQIPKPFQVGLKDRLL
jgi:cytochrome P450